MRVRGRNTEQFTASTHWNNSLFIRGNKGNALTDEKGIKKAPFGTSFKVITWKLFQKGIIKGKRRDNGDEVVILKVARRQGDKRIVGVIYR